MSNDRDQVEGVVKETFEQNGQTYKSKQESESTKALK